MNKEAKRKKAKRQPQMGSDKKSSAKKTKSLPDTVVAQCFIKPDRNGFVAICVNMSLSAQAQSIDEVIEKMERAIIGYLDYVSENHADNWVKYFNRPVPDEIMAEYIELVNSLRRKSTAKSSYDRPQKPSIRSMSWGMPFVKEIPTALSHASV